MLEKSVTQGIEVEVESFFVPEQSDKNHSRYFFSYRVRISNTSRIPVQLVARSWVITDGHGRTESVEGAGVIGQQPKLRPGEVFEYESFCPLETPTGTMRGSYQMLCLESGDNFQAEIPSFFLVEPSSFH
ncbi:MAG: Co2+/Mg2+ efflux protein ApaG [Proteobacteria bacterium]|nr:MAG: Co2+/Mg2+ efflux protein ApaG [Pseudomonadota bacterium]